MLLYVYYIIVLQYTSNLLFDILSNEISRIKRQTIFTSLTLRSFIFHKYNYDY